MEYNNTILPGNDGSKTLAFYKVNFYNVVFSDGLNNSYKDFFVIIKPTWNPPEKCRIIRIGFSQRPVHK